MKTLCLLLTPLLTPLLTLVLCCHWCFAAQPDAGDAGVIGVGDWSEPVSDGDGHTLRGRLVVCDDRPASASNHARVYLELQHVFTGSWPSPVEVYYDVQGTALNLELRDGHDQPVPRTPFAIRAPSLPPCWITLPIDATVRLRGDVYYLSTNPKPDGLHILMGSGNWIIPTSAPANAAGEFYLSGTFTPPADHPSALKYNVWKGTLKLPKVKIPPPPAQAVKVAAPPRADTTNDAAFANKIVEVFRDCQKIKAGMTRAELVKLQMFDEHSGPLSQVDDKSFKQHATFYDRSCSLIKVDVDFAATEAKEARPTDVITKVSMPYIDARATR